MDEQTQSIVDRARRLLAGIAGTRVDVTLVGDRIEAHHAFHTQSPAIVAALCTAVADAERRAEEAKIERDVLRQMLHPGAGVVGATIGELTRKCEVLQAENEDLTAELNRACVELTASDEAFESQARQYAAIRDEIDALRAEGFSMSAQLVAAERELCSLQAERDALKNKFTRLNPSTGEVEPWDPTETLREIRECVPDDRRLDGFTLAGAVSEMARLLAVAEAKVARLEDTGADLLAVAQGCTDYGGGHSGACYDAFQDGIGTVVNVLKKRLAGDDDYQMRVLKAVGSAIVEGGE